MQLLAVLAGSKFFRRPEARQRSRPVGVFEPFARVGECVLSAW